MPQPPPPIAGPDELAPPQNSQEQQERPEEPPEEPADAPETPVPEPEQVLPEPSTNAAITEASAQPGHSS